MTDKPNPMPMPVPRDHDDATMSEIMPFRSTKINLKKSPAFYFLILLAVTVPAMFLVMPTLQQAKSESEFISSLMFYSLMMTGVICVLLQTLVYIYSRTDRNYLHYLIPFTFAAAALYISPIFKLYAIPFRDLWPFWNMQAQGFVPVFLSMLGGAGLLEELLKGTPILLGAWLGFRMKRDPTLAQNKAAQFLHVRGPLDGAVMGAFAGAGFTFIETGHEYVTRQFIQVTQETRNAGQGLAEAFILLIPRALGSAIGHMAYAGIFGYFIGLAVLRPKQVWKLLAIGWLASSVIHALWNSVGQINFLLQYVIAGISAIGLASVMLKARQLENLRTGIAADTFGSIIVERPPVAPAAMPAAAATYAPPLAATAAVAEALALEIEGLQIPLRADGKLDLSAEPALAGRGVGVTGTIVPHPTRANVLGLRNSGTEPWTARLRDGSQQQIERDQNIRLASGITIAFGNGLFGSVVKLG